MREVNGILIARKDDKYRLIDFRGNNLTSTDYDYIYTKGGEYFIVRKDNKVGVINYQGKVIIPVEYDCIERCNYDSDCYEDSCCYYYFKKVYSYNGNSYFVLEKDGEFYLLNEKNEVLLTSKNEINFLDKLHYYYVIENNKMFFYSLEGKLIGSIKINSNWKNPGGYYIVSLANLKHMIYFDKNNVNTIYIIDDKLKETKIDNIFYEEFFITDFHGILYYLTSNYYIAKENDKYVQYSLESKEKLGEFSYIKAFSSNDYALWKDKSNIAFLACKDEGKCGVISKDGDVLFDFKYSLSIIKSYYFVLKNKDEKIYIIEDKGVKKLPVSCNFEDFDNIDWGLSWGNSSVIRLGGNLYNRNCEKITEKEISHHIEKNNYVIAETIDNHTKEEKDFPYIFDFDGKKINYYNPDNVKFKEYIGIYDNKIYFLTNKGIYYLTN